MDELVRLAEQLYPDRPIDLPDGPAVVVPVPERRAFIAGYTRARDECAAVAETCEYDAYPDVLSVQLRLTRQGIGRTLRDLPAPSLPEEPPMPDVSTIKRLNTDAVQT